MAKRFDGPTLKKRKSEHGLTLIEVIISLLILAIACGGMLNLFMDFGAKNAGVEYRRTAVILAKELMAEIQSKRFDQLTTKNSVTGWSILGTDAGETAGSKSTFNDVDDYNGLSETLASPFTGFTRTTSVVYVAAADLTTASASRLNDYKRVTVQVSNGGTTYAQLITVVSAAVTQAP